MDIPLIHEQFSSSEALDMVTRFVHLNIRFYEDKLAREADPARIEAHRQRIRDLQKYLYQTGQTLAQRAEPVTLQVALNIKTA